MDTRSKRASSVGLGLLWLASPVLPDGTLDQGDRQHTAISYSGILATALVVIDGSADVTIMVPARARTIIVPANSSVVV